MELCKNITWITFAISRDIVMDLNNVVDVTG